MEAAGNRLDVVAAVDDAPLGNLQLRVALLCAFVAMLDGFDTQSIAFVAPTLSELWSIEAGAFGPIFGAGLLGLMVGQLILGPLADRIGRRPVILLCTAWFGAFALFTAFAGNWTTLLLLRFLTGVGLGGAMPNIIALTSEYSPAGKRSTMITVMFGGFPFGAAVGGYISSRMIPAIGWESVFYLGGIAPLLLVIPLYFWLPDSVQNMVRSARPREQIVSLLRKLDPGVAADDSTELYVREKPVRGFSLAALFRDGLAPKTSLLWIAYFMSLLMIYFLMSWLPMILRLSGMPLDKAIIAAVALNLGGMLGGILLGTLLDRFNHFTVLAGGYFAAGACIACIGLSESLPVVLMAFVFAAGFAVIGGQTAMNAVASDIYPSRIRASGLGAALAVGRIGSIVGPVAGGILIGMEMTTRSLFAVGALPTIVACLAILSLKWIASSDTVPEARPATD
ncbi:MAG: MFS transporter [Proteobacteria bacterium]|nr:MFS transporter [Pseudomonadota bacterium]